jgi:hypothetical protein
MPIQKTKQKTELGDFVQYWVGRPKIGKTKIAAQFPNPLFLFTEQGASDMALPHWTPPNWDIATKGNYIISDPIDYDNIIAELLDIPSDKRPQTLVVDTIDGMVKTKAMSLMQESKVESINDGKELAFGRGIERVGNWLLQEIVEFQKLNMGIIFISHMVEKTISRVNAEPMTVWRDTLPDKFKPDVHGKVDWIWYFNQEGKQRRIYTQGDISLETGSRITLPVFIEMGKTPEEAYANILKAFYGREKNGNAGKQELIDRILKGEAYLAEKKIDNFDTTKRKENSRVAHLSSPDLGLNSMAVLQEYYDHLIAKAKGTSNGTT